MVADTDLKGFIVLHTDSSALVKSEITDFVIRTGTGFRIVDFPRYDIILSGHLLRFKIFRVVYAKTDIVNQFVSAYTVRSQSSGRNRA